MEKTFKRCNTESMEVRKYARFAENPEITDQQMVDYYKLVDDFEAMVKARRSLLKKEREEIVCKNKENIENLMSLIRGNDIKE